MRWRHVSLLGLFSFALHGCGGNSSPTTASSVLAVTIGPTPALTTAGQTGQLTATALLSTGTTRDVTATATWRSSNPAAATVSGSGVVTAVATGTTIVTAGYQGISGSIPVAVALTGGAGCRGGSLNAVVDGVPFTACLVLASYSTTDGGSSQLSITALESVTPGTPPRAIVLRVITAGPGTFPIARAAGGAGQATFESGNLVWQADSGSLLVGTLTPSAASGQFSFTASTGDQPQRVITNGTFNVTFF